MKFVDPSVAISQRKDLKLDATMRLEEYERLVAECAFPEAGRMECQLVNEKGFVCRTRFGRGWIALRKDGVEVFIGGDCADRHFRAAGEGGKEFRLHARRLELENRIAELRARIAARKGDPHFGAALTEVYRRCEELEVKARRECAALPREVLNRLFEMLRTMRRDVPGEVRYVEKDEDPNDSTRTKTIDVVRWRPVSLGVLQGLEGLNAGRVAALQGTVREAMNALRREVTDEKRLETTLKNQIAALEAADSVAGILDAFERSLDSFRQLANYKALCWLAVRDDDRETVVARYLTLAGQSSSPQTVKATIGVWRREIEESHGGRQFRARRDSY